MEFLESDDSGLLEFEVMVGSVLEFMRVSKIVANAAIAMMQIIKDTITLLEFISKFTDKGENSKL